MHYFLLYKLNIFSALIYFILAFVILSHSVRLKDYIGISLTYFAIFVILHSIILFTEIFLAFYPATMYAFQFTLTPESGVPTYLSWLNTFSVIALMFSIRYCFKRPFHRHQRHSFTLYLPWIPGLAMVLLIWQFPTQNQYQLIYLIWSVYAICFWYVNDCYLKKIYIKQKYNFGQLLAITLLIAAFSELFTKASLLYSIYAIITGILLCIGCFLYLNRVLNHHNIPDYHINQTRQNSNLNTFGTESTALVDQLQVSLEQALFSCHTINPDLDNATSVKHRLKYAQDSIKKAMQINHHVLSDIATPCLDIRQVNVASSLNEALKRLDFRLKEFDLQTDIPEEYSVLGNTNSLQSIWTNLLTNAMEACNNITHTILIEVAGDAQNVCITIIDPNDGQSEQPQHNTDSTDAIRLMEKRNALSLDRVGTIANRHHGEFHLFNEARGTCAQIILPRYHAA